MSTATPLVPEIASIIVTSLNAAYSSIFPLLPNAGSVSHVDSPVDPSVYRRGRPGMLKAPCQPS